MPDAMDLSGRRVLIVEDDFYLATDAERALRAAGARIVGPLPRSALALDALARDGIDAAVVDINLGDGPSFELADALRAAGVPFLFVTGYDAVQIPQRLADVTTVQKPADMRAMVRAVAALIGALPKEDGLSKPAPRDAARVDLSDAGEVRYWTRELGASEEVLREAVAAAGDGVEQVREYLGSGS